MREIPVSVIREKIAELCLKSNHTLPCDLQKRIQQCRQQEKTSVCQAALDAILENLDAAKKLQIPICQDTGMAVIFLQIGQEVHFTEGSLYAAIHDGVRDAYVNGALRCSIVSDPLRRVNTTDNTPACIHTEIIDGDQVQITVAPKGFGSENMSQLKMLTPAATEQDIINFVVSVADQAGSNPCPPIVVGVGLGGDFESCALAAKKALIRDTDQPNPDPYYAQLEQTMLQAINQTGIGAQGFGGSQTALAVHIQPLPTHIAGLPVAVNIGCHVTRHATVIL